MSKEALVLKIINAKRVHYNKMADCYKELGREHEYNESVQLAHLCMEIDLLFKSDSFLEGIARIWGVSDDEQHQEI